MMKRLKMQSLDVTGSNINKIAQLFPQCVTEHIDKDGKTVRGIDFEKLRDELSADVIDEGEERYQFTWPDKKYHAHLANTPTTKTLRPCREESVDFDHTQNLYIEGDNLDVLKVLRETYLGKVKMIYIDPPYNTGNDFVYNDDFSQDTDEYQEKSGQFDDDGYCLVQNTESNGRFHTDWLNMIYPRLKTVKDLLSDDGVIFISIDDNEQANLKKVCDEIFGFDNFIGCAVRISKTTSFRGNYFAPSKDYLLVYARNLDNVLPFQDEVANTIQFNKVEQFGNRKGELYRDDIAFYLSTLETRPNQRYYIECPDGEFVIPPGQTFPANEVDGEKVLPFDGDGVWRWECSQYKVKKELLSFKRTKTSPLLNSNGKKANWNIYTKSYLKDKLEKGNIPRDVLDSFLNRNGSEDVKKLNIPFQFPKPVTLIKYIMKICSTQKGIILDFFSGSATTAHAVMQLNAEDGGNRRFIMVQLPEKTDEKSEAYKAGYKNICEIGKERIRRAGRKIKEEAGLQGQDLDIGFRVLKLDSSNMKDVYYMPKEFTEQDLFADNVKPDRTSEDLLFQVMLDLGVKLSATIEQRTMDGKQVFFVDGNYLVACFDTDITEDTIKEIARLKPLYFVMRDSSLASDSMADNFDQLFETYSKDTIRRII